MEVIPGGSGGEEPSWPAPGGCFVVEDDEEWLRRVSAEAEDGDEEEWVCDEAVEAALTALSAGGSGRDAGGLAQGGDRVECVADAVPGDHLARHLPDPPRRVVRGVDYRVRGAVVPGVQQAPGGPDPRPCLLYTSPSPRDS